MLLAGDTTCSQHRKTSRSQGNPWYHKEDTKDESAKCLLPCSCCGGRSKDSDMSQRKAALKGSLCSCWRHFLKQTAALQSQRKDLQEQSCVQGNFLPRWQGSMPIQYGSHEPYVATKYLNGAQCNWGLDFKFCIILIKAQCKLPCVVSGHHNGWCRSRESNQESRGRRHQARQCPRKSWASYALSGCGCTGWRRLIHSTPVFWVLTVPWVLRMQWPGSQRGRLYKGFECSLQSPWEGTGSNIQAANMPNLNAIQAAHKD